MVKNEKKTTTTAAATATKEKMTTDESSKANGIAKLIMLSSKRKVTGKPNRTAGNSIDEWLCGK